MLDDTLKLLDVCSRMRDVIPYIGERHRGLLSALRRRGYISLDCQSGAYISAQKKMTKVSAQCLGTLKKDHKPQHQQSTQYNEALCELRQVGFITTLVCESLLSQFTAPRRRESIISFFLKPKLQQPNGQWESTSRSQCPLHSSGKVDDLRVKDARRQLESLDECVTNIDDQFGCISSHLI
ncbi:hypothetical protein AMTR_s00001p00233890 [Amborella trichopoda]|uniref:Uncharacterized protein n=1 Tax=Amborella trichopoda TaxID=13333 RepID=W1NLH0_AMBTC|nr:hypothetical protein AMTR_s00001p00233890 [Amborella trichopoda]